MITVLAQGVTHLADNDFGDNLGDGVAGPAGLLIIVLLVIATVFLVRNMNKRLKRLPASFPDPRDARPKVGSPVQENEDSSDRPSGGTASSDPDPSA